MRSWKATAALLLLGCNSSGTSAPPDAGATDATTAPEGSVALAEAAGPVDDDAKNELLGSTAAMVVPIQWDEPFGLVMVESMACGTPVVATRFGAVPEVIEQGRSGVIVDEFSELAAGVEQALSLDPAECRASAVERFSPRRMIEDYEAAYLQLVAGQM